MATAIGLEITDIGDDYVCGKITIDNRIMIRTTDLTFLEHFLFHHNTFARFNFNSRTE